MVVPWLTFVAMLPLIGAALACPLRPTGSRIVGVVTSVLTLGLAIVVLVLSQTHDLAEQVLWSRRLGVWYALQIDGLSGALVVVTAALCCAVLLVGFDLDQVPDTSATGSEAPQRAMRPAAFTPLVLVAEACAIAALLASDLVLFLVFFEASLIPMYLLIGCWGGVKRTIAASRFLLFGLAGGFMLLGGTVGVISISAANGRVNTLLSALQAIEFTPGTERLLFLLFFVAFAFKGPMVPFHAWLPMVAKEANPAVTALVVGVMDSLGGYAMIRFAVGLFPDAAAWAAPGILVAALVSIWYGGFAAAGSRHLSSLVVYTSISHFGFVVFGVFALTPAAVNGGALYLVAHALSVGALLLVCGVVQQTTGTAHIGEFQGLRQWAPATAGLFLVAGLATMALPGFLNFAAELQVLVGAWGRYPVLTLIAIVGTLFAAVYVLLAYQRVFTGRARNDISTTRDANGAERVAVGVLVTVLLVAGFVPQMLQNYMADAAPAADAIVVAKANEDGE